MVFQIHVASGTEDSTEIPKGKVQLQLEQVGTGKGTPLDEPVELDSGYATLTTKMLPVGTLKIRATYSGDQTFSSSSTDNLELKIVKAPTTTTLEVSQSEGLIVLKATVTCTAAKPTGQVDFILNGRSFFTDSLDDGSAQTRQEIRGAGNFVSAQYVGNANCDMSKSKRIPIP
jgi:hypothetical protein